MAQLEHDAQDIMALRRHLRPPVVTQRMPGEVERPAFAIDDVVGEAQLFEFLQRPVITKERFPLAVEDGEQKFRGTAIALPNMIPLGSISLIIV